MAHGFSATRELRLDAYAERFAGAGIAALLFDYRYFGASGGEPRQLLDIRKQQQDYEAAPAYTRGPRSTISDWPCWSSGRWPAGRRTTCPRLASLARLPP
jgi:hypothetical protein